LSDYLAVTIILALVALLAWREWLNARLVRDITSKIKAGSIYEYQMAVEPKKKTQEDKPKKVPDDVLGTDY